MLFNTATLRAFLAASGLAVVGMTGCTSSITQTVSSAPTRATATAIPTSGNQTMPTSNQTLQKLLVGNLRFEHGETVAQRQAIAQKQAPNTLSSPFGGWPGSMP